MFYNTFCPAVHEYFFLLLRRQLLQCLLFTFYLDYDIILNSNYLFKLNVEQRIYVLRSCPHGYTCLGDVGGNPNFGYTSFDNLLWSMLTTFQLITLDYWENIYNMVSFCFTVDLLHQLHCLG